MIAGIGALLAVLIAVGVAVWVIAGRNDGAIEATPTPSPATSRPAVDVSTTDSSTITSPEPSAPRRISLPGTDDLGFMAYPGARCNAGDRPAALGLTNHSAVIVCEYAQGAYYYRGVRLSDGASIHLNGAYASAGGFDVTNPADGTIYQIRPQTLTITGPDNQPYVEAKTEYAS